MKTMNKWADNLKKGLNDNQDLKKDLDGLKKKAEKLSQSETVKKAQETINKSQEAGRQAYEKAKTTFSEGFEQASKASEQAKEKIKESVGSGVFDQISKTFSGFKKLASDYTQSIRKTAEPVVSKIPKTAAADQPLLSESYRYGGMTSKEFRNKIKEARLGTSKPTESQRSVDENPEAGANVVLHKDSRWKEAWGKFKDNNPVMQSIFTMRRNFEESDNPIVNTARFFSERIRDMMGSVFEETEHAQALAEIRMIDPTFNLEEFMKDAREFMIPEVMEAYVDWDQETLKQWCSDAVMSVLEASREPLVTQGMVAEGKILDLRNVELVMAKLMEDTPLLILTFKTQQTEIVRKMTGEVVSGSEDRINDVFYIWALTKDPEQPNPLTRGWKVSEFAVQAVRESF